VYRADKQTFEDANQICLDMGARLAIANTVNEAILLSNLAQHSQNTFQFVFVGRFFDGRFWQTVDGQ
jgi:hypothetical protein